MKSNLNRAWIIVFFYALVFVSCKPDRDLEKSAERPADIKPLVVAPEFNADSAYSYIRKQVEFGPRIPNTPSHFQTGTYLETKLKSFNAVVELQEFQEYFSSCFYASNFLKGKNSPFNQAVLFLLHVYLLRKIW